MMPAADKDLLQRLQNYCLTKPGAEPTSTPFGPALPTYRVLEGFLLHYAQFNGNLLTLRCPDERLQVMHSRYPDIRKSAAMKWDTTGWAWINVPLDGSVPEAEVSSLIDDSYALLIASLNDQERQLIALEAERLTLPETLNALIDMYELTERRAEILELVGQGILLRTTPAEDSSLALGQSKIGGVPDLPSGVAWPRYHEKQLAFVAQINLAEIPADVEIEHDYLPRRGILFFFSVYGWQLPDGDLDRDLIGLDGTAGCTQVLFFDDPRALSTLQRSIEIPQEIKVFKAAAIEFLNLLSIPYALDDSDHDPVFDDMDWDDDELERLGDLQMSFSHIQRKALGFPSSHQMLGYAQPIQEAVTTSDTQLLLQLDNDDHADMEWHDGNLYFVIPRKALTNRDFSAATAELQFS